MERKLASIRTIAEVKPIDGADLICAYRVDGWWVVGKKDEFKIGDLCVYFEIDSWIPHELASFLSKGKEPRKFNGIKGERLKTVKLKGQISQGLLLPLKVLNEYGQYCTRFDHPNYWLSYKEKEGEGIIVDHVLGADVTEFLGIQKWEVPIGTSMQGAARGNFPSWCRKTDQERCLSDNTIIDTDSGKYTIKHIVDNKLKVKVLSLNHDTNIIEYKDIKDWSVMTRKNNWIKITLKSGATIVCTTNHKIWCADISAYRNAEDIKIGQKFVRKTDEIKLRNDDQLQTLLQEKLIENEYYN